MARPAVSAAKGEARKSMSGVLHPCVLPENRAAPTGLRSSFRFTQHSAIAPCWAIIISPLRRSCPRTSFHYHKPGAVFTQTQHTFYVLGVVLSTFASARLRGRGESAAGPG